VSRVAVALLESQLDEAYHYIRDLVEGLSEDEFWWEPVGGCWTVRQDATGRWSADYPEPPHPVPAPFTTIAWRLVHVGECKLMYHEHAYGPGELSWLTLDSAHTAKDATSVLERGQHLLRGDLARMADSDLEAEVRTNWGAVAGAPDLHDDDPPRLPARRRDRCSAGPLSRAAEARVSPLH
jgi:hypothetical protein